MPATQNEAKCCTIHVEAPARNHRNGNGNERHCSRRRDGRRQIFGNTFDKFPCECRVRAAQACEKSTPPLFYTFDFIW